MAKKDADVLTQVLPGASKGGVGGAVDEILLCAIEFLGKPVEFLRACADFYPLLRSRFLDVRFSPFPQIYSTNCIMLVAISNV